MTETRRIFKNKTTGITVLKELMQNIFVGELLKPSNDIWIVSPWISNINLIENRGGDFDIINPDWRGKIIKLEDIIVHVSLLKTKVYLATNNDPHNEIFINSLSRKLNEKGTIDNVEFIRKEELHLKKGLLNDHGSLSGSMNITYYGIEINDEQITYTLSKEVISQDKQIFEKHYLGNRIL